MNNRNYYEVLSYKDIKTIGGRIAADEEFKPVKCVEGWLISSYGRIISKRQRNAKIVKTNFVGGYEHVTTRIGDRVGKIFAVHQLVAQHFLSVPDWIRENDIIEVHHLKKVNRKKRIAGINSANNLAYVPKCIHRTIDSIAVVQVYRDGRYRPHDFVKAAEQMGISPYTLADVVRQEPTIKREKWSYYKCDINAGGAPVNVDFRIMRTKDI